MEKYCSLCKDLRIDNSLQSYIKVWCEFISYKLLKVPKTTKKLIYIKTTRTKKLKVGWGMEDQN